MVALSPREIELLIIVGLALAAISVIGCAPTW